MFFNRTRTRSGKKECLSPYAEVSAAEVVFCKELAGRAEAADHFHGSGSGLSAGTEEFGGLVFAQKMFLVVLAVHTIFSAELPVLFGIFDCGLFGFKHEHSVLR